jgi:phage repressor protein C with HTH and peptisase S24 domain
MPRRKSNPFDCRAVQTPEPESTKQMNKRLYGDRIQLYRKRRKLSQPKLADMLGVTKNSVANWETGNSRPEFDTLTRLCVILDISADTFFSLPNRKDSLSNEEREHLQMYHALSPYERKSVDTLMAAMLENNELEFREECERNFTRLPRAPLPVSAGTGMPLDGDEEQDYVYLRVSADIWRADEVITVRGDSMEPTFHDGDDILVEHTEKLNPGEIGIFIIDGEGFVKEYRPDGLHSHNPKYPPIRPTENGEVRCVGRVLGVVPGSWCATARECTVLDKVQSKRQRKNERWLKLGKD